MTNSEHITDEETMIYPRIGNSILAIRPESNSSAEEFMELLQGGDITMDMMLLHHPGVDDVKAYKAMETYAEQGKIRSLGLSNTEHIKENLDLFGFELTDEEMAVISVLDLDMFYQGLRF